MRQSTFAVLLLTGLAMSSGCAVDHVYSKIGTTCKPGRCGQPIGMGWAADLGQFLVPCNGCCFGCGEVYLGPPDITCCDPCPRKVCKSCHDSCGDCCDSCTHPVDSHGYHDGEIIYEGSGPVHGGDMHHGEVIYDGVPHAAARPRLPRSARIQQVKQPQTKAPVRSAAKPLTPAKPVKLVPPAQDPAPAKEASVHGRQLNWQ